MTDSDLLSWNLGTLNTTVQTAGIAANYSIANDSWERNVELMDRQDREWWKRYDASLEQYEKQVQDQYEYNEWMFDKQYQANKYLSSYGRKVSDARAAGLNPYLVVDGDNSASVSSSGASVPSAGQPSSPSYTTLNRPPLDFSGLNFAQIADIGKVLAETSSIDAMRIPQIESLLASSGLTRTQIASIMEKLPHEIRNTDASSKHMESMSRLADSQFVGQKIQNWCQSLRIPYEQTNIMVDLAQKFANVDLTNETTRKYSAERIGHELANRLINFSDEQVEDYLQAVIFEKLTAPNVMGIPINPRAYENFGEEIFNMFTKYSKKIKSAIFKPASGTDKSSPVYNYVEAQARDSVSLADELNHINFYSR